MWSSTRHPAFPFLPYQLSNNEQVEVLVTAAGVTVCYVWHGTMAGPHYGTVCYVQYGRDYGMAETTVVTQPFTHTPSPYHAIHRPLSSAPCPGAPWCHCWPCATAQYTEPRRVWKWKIKKPLLLRPSRTPKTNPKKKLCYKSLPTLGASTWLLCVESKDLRKIALGVLDGLRILLNSE